MLTLGFKELMRTVPFLTKRGLLEDIDSLFHVEPGARFCGGLLIWVWNQEK